MLLVILHLPKYQKHIYLDFRCAPKISTLSFLNDADYLFVYLFVFTKWLSENNC